MNLATAQTTITDALARMSALYQQTVFDEWIILALLPDRGTILAYNGPRAEAFRQGFAKDIKPLRDEMTARQHAVGDFEFAPVAVGTHFDALIRVGEASYLICNHTVKTMAQIRENQRWLKAQKAFVELSDKFRTDPLE